METSASYEARSAPSPYPTSNSPVIKSLWAIARAVRRYSLLILTFLLTVRPVTHWRELRYCIRDLLALMAKPDHLMIFLSSSPASHWCALPAACRAMAIGKLGL